jgi:uncharacterized membrane protein HdeD (DUF308 family)
MSTTSPSRAWIKAGLVALPVYGLLEHLASGVVGAILAIFGTFALGSLLANSRTRRSALWGTVLAVAGHILLLVPGTISTFATPVIGAAYLSGNREVMALSSPRC